MDISEVAKRTGVPASTLRYYENRGLISSLAAKGARRRFAPMVLDQLALIALGQAAGLSLDEVQSMLSPNGRPNIDRRLLAAKADELDAAIRQLSAVRRGLRHAAACPARSHAECPTFKKLLRAAASGALDRRQKDTMVKPPKAPLESRYASQEHDLPLVQQGRLGRRDVLRQDLPRQRGKSRPSRTQ